MKKTFKRFFILTIAIIAMFFEIKGIAAKIRINQCIKQFDNMIISIKNDAPEMIKSKLETCDYVMLPHCVDTSYTASLVILLLHSLLPPKNRRKKSCRGTGHTYHASVSTFLSGRLLCGHRACPSRISYRSIFSFCA